MPQVKPTNGELAVMITSLTQEMRDGHQQLSATCGSIESQAKATNGRLRKLEEWKYMLIGGFVIVNLVAIPLVIDWLQKLVNH